MAEKAITNSKLALVKQAHADQRDVITDRRVQYIEALADLDSIGGTDDIKESVLKIVQETVSKFPGGIPYPFVQAAFDGTELINAVKTLVTEKKIKKEGKKGRYVLLPVTE